jgi:predicted kinase
MLLIVCGLPGTGKTHVSKKLASKFNATHFRTDDIRKQLLEQRTYSDKEKELVYEKLFEHAQSVLEKGKNVILDATFYKNYHRKQVVKLAKQTKTPIYFIECVLSPKSVKERLENRKNDLSEADVKVYQKLKRNFEPLRQLHLELDTSKPFKDQFKEIQEFIKRMQSKRFVH